MPLAYIGPGAPAVRPDRGPRRAALLVLIALGALVSWFVFDRREKRLGRFDPLPPVDRGWIAQNLLPLRAETVGAAWDHSVKQSEVAALLARLVAEKKIETKTIGSEKSPELHMELKVPREELSGYERELVDKFFFSGNTTNTEAIRANYKSSGLDPAGLIRPAVTLDADTLLGGGKKARGVFGCLGTIAFLMLLGFGAVAMPDERKPVAFIAAGALFVLFVVASSIANYWQSRPDFGRKQALWMLLPWALILAAVSVVSSFEPPLLVEILLGAAAVCAIATSASVAASKQSSAAIDFRRKLAAVRNYFRAELARPQPQLDDAWFPYVLAFGLGTQAEKWFKAFGGVSSGAGAIAHSTSSSSLERLESGWSGGRRRVRRRRRDRHVGRRSERDGRGRRLAELFVQRRRGWGRGFVGRRGRGRVVSLGVWV